MADPLSVTASIIAVVGTAHTVTKGLRRLKAAKDAPEGLQDLISDVAQLEMVLNCVKSVVLSSSGPPIELATLIGEAGSKLLEVQSLIGYTLTEAGVSNQVNRWQWLRKGNEVERLRTQLDTIRLNLVTLTSSANFGVLQRVSIVTQDLSSEQQRLNAQMTNVLPRQEALLNQLCQKIEESQATQEAMMRLLGNFRQVDVNMASDNAAALSETPESRPGAPIVASPRMRSRREFHIQNLRVQSACPNACTCNCHRTWKIYSPRGLRRLFGHSEIEGAGLPFFRRPCSLRSCKGKKATFIYINFFLPAMIAARMISLWFTSSPLCAPELLLRVSRVMRTDTAAYRAIRDGDLDAVKCCISAGDCKPWDIDDRGQSLIAAALQHGNSTIAFYLAQVVSDNYECLGETYHGIWWYHTADGTLGPWIYPFRRTVLVALVLSLRPGEQEGLSSLDLDSVSGVDWNELLDTNGFSELHKIVAGASSRPLSVEIEARPEDLDRQDSVGLTALWWACWFGNSNHIRILLNHGADVNNGGITPIWAAIWSGSFGILEQLLNADASIADSQTDLLYNTLMYYEIPPREGYLRDVLRIDKALFGRFLDMNYRPSNSNYGYGPAPLLVLLAQRHRPYSHARMRQLLELGADTEVTDCKGVTALYYAISQNNIEACKMLGRAGANANIRTKAGHTILHLAIRNATDAIIIQAMSELDLLGVELGAKDDLACTAFERFKQRAGRHRNNRYSFPEIYSFDMADLSWDDNGMDTIRECYVRNIDTELQILSSFQNLLQQVQEAQGIPIEDRYPLLDLTYESIMIHRNEDGSFKTSPSVPGAWPET